MATLENFRCEYENETEEVKAEMGRNLVFTNLLALLESDQQALLSLLTHFRIPVQSFAIKL